MKNILWYVRDGHLDFLTKLSFCLKSRGNNISSFYVCHNPKEKKKLEKYQIEVKVLSRYINERSVNFTITDTRIREIERDYNTLPLIMACWSEMHEKRYPEAKLIFHLVAHIEFWEKYLLENRIKGVVSERPSILSTNVLWMVCKKHQIKFIDFFTVGPDNRIFFTSSWNGEIDLFEDNFKTIEIIHESETYKKSLEYLEKMLNRPEKPEYIFKNLITGAATKGEYLYYNFNVKSLMSFPRRLMQNTKNNSYYMNIKPSELIRYIFIHRLRSLMLRFINLFEETHNIYKEKYFLFPLNVEKEWANYSSLGLKYTDSLSVLKEIAACLPLNYKLYVKEHTSGFPDKSLAFYRNVKKINRVRLISPHENSFNLIKNAEGLITLGGSMGWEAFLLGKPVVIIGDPWYRFLSGVFKAENPKKLSELLQNISAIPEVSYENKLRAVYTLFQISFEAIRYPLVELNEPENIEKYAQAFEPWISSVE